MAALHDTVICGKRQLAIEAGVALSLVIIELLTHHVDICDLEVICRELTLVFEENVSIGHGRAIGQVAPHDVIYGIHALNVHGDTLKTIGDLDGNGIDLDSAHLLEIGELGNLHAIEPDLPAKAPGTKRRALPVVFNETHIVLVWIQADSRQRIKIQFLTVYRRRLNKYLELVIVLHTVGVLAITTVGWTTARLRIAGPPGIFAQGTQQGCSMECTRTDLGVIRLHDDTALFSPILLETQDDFLERESVFLHT